MTTSERFVQVMANAVLAVALVLIVCPATAEAQGAGDTGTIYGVVTDETGAVIPGADVTVVNDSTGISRSTTTGQDGNYQVTQLRVGTYTVTVKTAGFKSHTRSSVIVAVTEATSIDVTLTVGAQTETIEVQASPVARVETREVTLGTVIEQRRIVEMPLNGRNFIQLAYFVPGAVQSFRPIAIKGSPTGIPGGVGNMPFVNGMRNTMNAILIDGALNNDPVLNTAAIVPRPDSIQEFKIQTNLYTAEYGQGGGSVISIVTKSGGLDFHGSAYYFGRNDRFDARNFFTDETPPLERHQFGVAVGGPIGGGGNTFFFANYEGLRLDKGVILNSLVPSLAQRSGDFSALASPLTDPVGGCITGNIIDPACFDIIATSSLTSRLWPEPNSGVNGFRATPLLTDERDQLLVKIDHNTEGWGTFTGRWVIDDGIEETPVAGVSGAGLSTGSGVPGFPATNPGTYQNIMLAHTFVVSPTSVNSFRFTFLRADFGNNLLVGARPAPWGPSMPSPEGFTFPVSQLPALPAISAAGFALTGAPGQKDFTKGNNIFLWADTFALEAGSHSLRVGGEVRRSRADINTGNFTHGLIQFRGTVTGNGFADYLFGAPFGMLQVTGDAERDFRSTSYALFLQDAYRIRPNLTLNFGVRWEVFGPFGDPHIQRVGHPRLHTFIPGRQSTWAPDLPLGIVLGGFDEGIRETIVATDYNNLAPRVGIAWDPFGKGQTSIRLGYGVFFDATVLDGVINSTDGTPSIRSAVFPISLQPYTFADPFQGLSPFTPPITFPIPSPAGVGLSPTIVSPDQRTAYVQQWNFTIQQELPGSMRAQIGYVGTMGTKLTGPIDQAQACLASVASPCHNGETTNTSANLASRRFYPRLNGLQTVSGVFRSNYHGLQAELTRRFEKGFAFQLAYTLSKAIDYSSKVNTFFDISGQSNLQNNLDWQDERGLAAFDVRNRFVANFTYELPFGKNMTGAAKQALGGWQVNGIVTLQSGGPFTVFDSAGRAIVDSGSAERPDLVPGCDPNSGAGTVEEWFNTACFTRVPQGVDPITGAVSGIRFGTAGRNITFVDGISQLDFSVTKRFPISEDTRFEFRAEFFNLFNHPDFGVPINNIISGAFGQVLNTSVDERQIQFALKLIF